MQVMHPDVAIDDDFVIAGPLNLNKRMMRADTVMGERLQLSPQQFRTLLMLVLNEGVSIPFEELHMFMSLPDEEKYSIQAARDVIMTLVNILNISGRGFAKINMLPNDEYAFVTKWGMDWRPTSENEEPDIKKKQETVASGSSDRFSKTVLSVSMVAALIVFVGSYFAFNSSDNGLVYIPMAQIPLAEMPNFSQPLEFPYIGGDVFFAKTNGSIYIDTNTPDGDVVFVLSLSDAALGVPLARSILVPRGEATNTLFFSGSLAPGRHAAELTLTAFCGRYLTEIGDVVRQVAIYVD